MYAHVAIHNPDPERFADALAASQEISESIKGAAGLRKVFVGHDVDRRQVFAMTLWDEPTQFENVFPIVQAAVRRTGIRNGETASPQVLKFIQAGGSNT